MVDKFYLIVDNVLSDGGHGPYVGQGHSVGQGISDVGQGISDGGQGPMFERIVMTEKVFTVRQGSDVDPSVYFGQGRNENKCFRMTIFLFS